MTLEENIQIAKAGYAAFGRGDIAGVLAVCDPAIEWTTPSSVPMGAGGTLKGHEEVTRFFAAVAATWNFEVFEPREFIASGDQVLVRGFYRARSNATGRVAASDWVMAWRFRNGKTTHFQEYTDTAVLRDALAA